ncbi:PREDICTED: protein AF-9 [Nicrophorus vespilloides]|uniref:Protein AF-9 n=1 Tax=Nicrophorus vespilloides TaxID=110193 RepID=A0ABM1NJF3_NICVS|nr:PREDICTED: protein AF-9 [Nicrophorus vespilloides]
MAVRINLELGHEASIRNKRTQEGFTHDWEVFVRGFDGADIQCYVEKVVFYLHETFNKPKRVFKEPPYSIKESGYAGFLLPIEIYLKNKEEPKKIKYSYDLTLQPSGPAIYKVQMEKHVFTNPTDDFKHKLLKGGGTIVNSNNSMDMNDVKMNSDDKNQLVNKPKLGGSDMQKKYKTKSDEEKTNFHSLFGTPIKKSSKISPDPAKVPTKDSSKLSSSSSKDRGSGDKDKMKNKSPIKDKDKERDRDRAKDKESSSERKNKDKSKDRNKERDRSKEKSSSKRPRSSSPKRLPSPKRPASPKVQSPSLPKHEDKQRSSESIGKPKDDIKTEKKYKKDKYSDKYKDSGKEHKKESSKVMSGDVKEGATMLTSIQKELSPMPLKMKEKPKELVKDIVSKETDSMKSKDKADEKKEKHKHKKKDKDKDKDKREKSKEDRHKSEKSKGNNSLNNVHNNKYDATKETETKTMVSPMPEAQLPPLLVSPPAPAPIIASATSKSLKQPLFSENENSNSSLSSKEETAAAYGSSPAVPAPPKTESLFDSLPKDQLMSDKSKPKKDKSRKKDKKSDKEDKKRKRKLQIEDDDEPDAKHFKPSATVVNSISAVVGNVDSDGDQVMAEAHASTDLDKENQENPEDYMRILRELQHKIMTLQDNAELQRVVQLIAETGRYEVSARTFDFDLCLLERSTVRRLQEFFSLSSSS